MEFRFQQALNTRSRDITIAHPVTLRVDDVYSMSPVVAVQSLQELLCPSNVQSVTTWYEQIMKSRMVAESAIASYAGGDVDEAVSIGKSEAFSAMEAGREESSTLILHRIFSKWRASESYFSARKALASQLGVHSAVSYLMHRHSLSPREFLFSAMSGQMLSVGIVPSLSVNCDGTSTDISLNEGVVIPFRLTGAVKGLLHSPWLVGIIRATMGNVMISLEAKQQHFEVWCENAAWQDHYHEM